MSTPTQLNPQPLPPGVQLGALTQEVTLAIRAALAQRVAGESGASPSVFRNPRIVIGLILEPHVGGAAGD